MKINGYELQPHEIKLFDMASRNSTSVRVVGFLIDIVIFALMLVTVFTIGGYGVWLFNFIYGFQLFVVLCAFWAYVTKTPLEVNEVLQGRLISYANSSLDWPFGHLGVISTSKNFVVMLAAIPLIMADHTVLAILLPITWLMNNACIYARGNLTLDVIDHILKQGKYTAQD